MTLDLDREVLLDVDSARLKVLVKFVEGLAHLPDTEIFNGSTLRDMAKGALEQSMEAGKQAFYKGSIG